MKTMFENFMKLHHCGKSFKALNRVLNWEGKDQRILTKMKSETKSTRGKNTKFMQAEVIDLSDAGTERKIDSLNLWRNRRKVRIIRKEIYLSIANLQNHYKSSKHRN